jgi:DNA polymerase-2
VGYVGAISFGIPGRYKNVYKLDVASLYPSIIRQYKIYSKDKDPKANFLNIVETLTIQRLQNKRLAKETGDQYYKDLESSQKITINSAYGFLGATGLNYNYPEGAAKVTEYGREILNKAVLAATGKKAEDYMVKEEEENGEDE